VELAFGYGLCEIVVLICIFYGLSVHESSSWHQDTTRYRPAPSWLSLQFFTNAGIAGLAPSEVAHGVLPFSWRS